MVRMNLHIHVGWNKSHVSGETYQITLNINQTVNSNPSFFTMPVQVKFNTTLGDTTVTLFNDQQVQNFQFDINGDPQSISFDPGNWILKNSARSLQKLKIQLFRRNIVLSRIILIRLIQLTNIKFRISDSGFVTLKVYDVLGNEVATLVNEEKAAGSYKVEFSANGLSSGTY